MTNTQYHNKLYGYTTQMHTLHQHTTHTHTTYIADIFVYSELVALCSEQQVYGNKRLYSVLSSSDEESEGEQK